MSQPDVDWAWDIGQAVLDVTAAWYTARIADTTLGAESTLPTMQFVSEGLPAWDCDLLTVYVERIYPTTGDPTVPTPTMDASMRYKIAAQMRLLLIRCAALSSSELDPIPTAPQMEASARVVLRDAITLRNALSHGLATKQLGDCRSLVFGEWAQLGPDGGFVGGVLSFFVARG